MPLGFDPELFLNNPVAKETRQALLTGIQQLGQQVQQGIQQIVTTRDLRAMGEELRGIDPKGNDFAMRMVDVITNHPLAVRDQRGIAAINLLGNAHKEWRAQQLRSVNSFSPLSGGRGILNRQTGAVTEVPEEMQPFKRPISTKSGAVLDPITGEELFPAPEQFKSVPPGSTLFNTTTQQPIYTAPPRQTADKTGLNMLVQDRASILRRLEMADKAARSLDIEANRIAYEDRKKPLDQSSPDNAAGQRRLAAIREAERVGILTQELQAKDSAIAQLVRGAQGAAAPIPGVQQGGSFGFGAGSAPTVRKWTQDASGRWVPQ